MKKKLRLHVLRLNSQQQFCVFLQISSFSIKLSKNSRSTFGLKGKRTNLQTSSESTLIIVFKSNDLQCFLNFVKLVRENLFAMAASNLFRM